MRRSAILVAALAAATLAASPASASAPEGWAGAVDARRDLGAAQTALALGETERARDLVARADTTLTAIAPQLTAPLRRELLASLAQARTAAGGDASGLADARAAAWTTLLRAGLAGAVADARNGDAAGARQWLLVREFRAPTRFTRAGTDATLAVTALARGKARPQAAARSIRTDLLDTYEAKLRTALDDAVGASRRGFSARLAEEAALARGYAAIVGPSYRSQRGEAAAAELERALDKLEQAAMAGTTTAASVQASVDDVDRLLEGFRAAPLQPAEQARRAGQLDRFLRLVPIEYDRGVEGTRVTLAFEIQEAISFRNAVAVALADISPELLARDPAATRELTTIVDDLGRTLDAAGAGGAAPAEAVRARADRALELIDDLYPDSWKEAASGADFDVIAASIDRLAAAAKAGSWSRAEQARLEAYGIFELGPEQRLRGIAPSLFQRIEGLFWYGDDGQAGLVQLVKRKDAGAELEESVAALQAELEQAAQRVGSSSSTAAVISNSAIVVFREGLEAVLILAALMASMVGVNRRYRRPLLAGAALALAASAVTWVIAQTVLGSLALYGEKLEAIVSVIAIGVLLLILNWFYHRVYWAEHLADFHKRKQRILRGSHVGFISAQVLGLAALGFSSVYREGFETVLFLQALTLEAGIVAVLPGVMLGLAATLAVGGLTILLERKLPHRKMLIATGILMTWVLVILVGTTVQTFQVVGWMPVTPIEGLQLPYWTGAWLGIYPTWEGLAAQVGAAAFVIGSYVAAEQVRARKRRRILSPVPAVAAPAVARADRKPELAGGKASAR